MDIEKYISPLISSQFPSFYKEQGPNFIAFVKAYYEWLEQEGNPIYHSRRLMDYTDIDSTAEEFIIHFKNTYIDSLPENILADKRLLMKHILDLYRSKGTQRSYELLFRLLFNENIEIYFPGKHLFTSSEAKWTIPKYIEVSTSEFLPDIVGKKIYSEAGSGIVENFVTQKVNNKIVNILNISNLFGNFKFGEKIYCDDLYVNSVTGKKINLHQYDQLSIDQQMNYTLAITSDNAPVIFGSLSAISIVNGGANYNVGDIVDVYGSGNSAIAKVISTRNQNGLVSFSLIDGGFGFTVNAVVTVTGGGGAGASFKIGNIVNKQIYKINTDIINDYYNTQLDIDSSGFSITVDTISGTFSNGDTVTSSANSVEFDVTPVGDPLAFGDILSNTSLGIGNLLVYKTETNFLAVTGPDADLTNANLTSGVILENGVGGAVSINSMFGKQTISSNAIVTDANSTVITVNNAEGGSYYLPNSTLTDANSSATANIVSVSRNTDWAFPSYFASSNLDAPPIIQALNFYDLEVGTIAYLSQINPGAGYSSDPTVDIIEPEIYNLQISDGNGGYYGYNATVTAKAGTANGIVTSVEVIDSGYSYNQNETLSLYSANNPVSITGVSIIDLNGVGSGYWENHKSFPSDSYYLQDSYYYQNFSYEILSKKMLYLYEKAVNDLIHPSGYKLFGGYINKNELVNESSQLVLSEISNFESNEYTVDQTAIKADNSGLTVDRYYYDITVDSTEKTADYISLTVDRTY